ncbi:MAG: hypothetical protein ABI645_09070 [Pseudomonadota bacterium]
MRTFLQVLRLAFWINPLQRVLTCIGVVFIVTIGVGALSNSPPYLVWHRGYLPIDLLFSGSIIATIATLLMSGVYWRIASAPRIVRLAPRGRTRLIAGIIGVVLLVALLWAVYWRFSAQWVHPEFPVSLTTYLAGVADSALLPSVAVVGLFIASRSPLAALAVLILLVSPGVASVLFDVNLLGYMRGRILFSSPGPGALMLLALIWIPFTIWYLRARRISPPAWLGGDGQDVLATNMVSWARPRSRRVALERQLLGGITIVRFGLQWFVVLGLLLGLQWLLLRVGEPSEPAVVARVMYASLCICPVVTTVVSFAAIRRSRALWLLTASTRGEFFACVELILRRLHVVMMLVFASWLAVLWFSEYWQPGPGMDRIWLLWGLSWLGLFAIYAQFAGWPKWPVAIVAAGATFSVWGFFDAPASNHWSQAAEGLTATSLIVTAGVASIALRWHAHRRWRKGDFPRAVTSTASGT